MAIGGCTATTSLKPSPSPSAIVSSSAAASATPSTSATASDSPSTSPSASPSSTPAPSDPQFVPALAAIQMVGPWLGWAAGSHAIFATTDGSHWGKQFASTEEFVGVDFVSSTTGWVVGARTLLGTTDGGHTWQALGEAHRPIRSVHFINALEGWGISGGNDPQMDHGWLLPSTAGTMVSTQDGGRTWVNASSPTDPQTVCFSDRAHGWLATMSGSIYASNDGGSTWTKSLDMYQAGSGVGRQTIIECAAPAALWVLTTVQNGAAGHLPYVSYATQDGRSWRTVMAEPITSGAELPGVPAGPDSHPGSFSVIDPMDAVFIGDGPATNLAQCVIASAGGASLRRTGHIENSSETFGAAFTSATTGWVLTRNAGGDYVIDVTADGGYHWSQQLAVPPTSAG
ncbi:MAG TPA: YCF48-related protein [Candidatus Dormibacteraeota bacterium]|nr:YCF48-related protein [Candidatus Dormibacteraeota bacterium]